MRIAGATNEVATLKDAVSKAENNAAAERTEREKQEARVAEVRQELQALVEKHESLEPDSKTRESELASALERAKAAKAEAHKALQEIEEVKKIAAGKAFFMQSKHVNVNYLLLIRIRSSPGAFADLPRRVYDASAFYRAEEGSSTEKVFWSQYAEARHPVPLSNQLKQLVELHKAAEQAMKRLIVRLWPGEALPGSYFGLVRRLVDRLPAGSHLVLSHTITSPSMPDVDEAVRFWNEHGTPKLTQRTPEDVVRFFDGLELLEPGVVSCSRWRPENDNGAEPEEVAMFGGVARKN